jgi:alanyl aminopeptidase
LLRPLLRLAALAALASGCWFPRSAPVESPPLGRLPADVEPLRYRLELEIVPERERYSGRVAIEVGLAHPRSVLWLHGRDLAVSAARVSGASGALLDARWEEIPDSDGVAALRLPQPVGPGRISLEIEFDAAFGRQLRGLYRVDADGRAYAFTQFEPTSARQAFPCFDEPVFKTPFDVSVRVPADAAAIANTRELRSTQAPGGLRQVEFSTTPKLPTYLVALAVGPLDVVEAPAFPPAGVRTRPLPLRGVAARGRGPELAHALGHTRDLLEALERYFAIPYPFDKLDLIAVPDFASGAMENAGAIVYRDALLLLDPRTAPESQRRAFAIVHAHELAHQWLGNLVTMPWWDDLWLNEAFATWMAAKVVDEVFPEQRTRVGLLAAVQGAMAADGLASARSIRQPIESPHDIRNAFDVLTYQKGAGVLAMFERWLGPDAFRAGIQSYLKSHAWGSATSRDWLDALSRAASQDVEAPFWSFLDQPGVPFVDVSARCEGDRLWLRLRQSRFLPLGSTADSAGSWQIPFCTRLSLGMRSQEFCSLLSGGDVELDAGSPCPDRVHPNPDGAGYYRFALSGVDPMAGFGLLGPGDRMALADALMAGFSAGRTRADRAFEALEPLASDPERAVARVPMQLLRFAREWLVDPPQRKAVERRARELYRPVLRELGWKPYSGEEGETRLARAEVVDFLAEVGRDSKVRRRLARLGRQFLGIGSDGRLHPDRRTAELLDSALAVAIEDGGAPVWDAALAQFERSQDGFLRAQLLRALGSATDPGLSRRALELALDPRLRVSETTAALAMQLRDVATRDAAWSWTRAHWDELVARLSERGSGWLPWLVAGFCSEAHAAEAEAFLATRVQAAPGGPRNLAGALETVRVCAAGVAHHRERANAYFASRPG